MPSSLSASRRLRFLAVLGLATAGLFALPACQVRYRREVERPGTPAQFTYSAGGFTRYDGYDDVAGDLETATREYQRPGSGTKIRLVGAIHIGDLEYYRELQKRELDTADVVLFEGVKFEGGASPPDLGGVYGAMGTLLGIGFQKDGIDYKAPNFVHCDVTVGPGDPLFQTIDPEQVNQAAQLLGPIAQMKGVVAAGGDSRRIEDALKHGMVTVMAAQMSGEDADDAARKAAEKLGGAEDSPLRGPAERAFRSLRKIPNLPGMSEDMRREVLERRNRYVLDRLHERLVGDGDGKKQTIAVFYGAAHLPGMEKELESWGYRPVGTTWLRAWRMNGRGRPVVDEEGTDGPVPAGRSARKEPTLF